MTTAKGGRPRLPVDPGEVQRLRGQGKTWREVGRALGISPRSAHRLGRDGTGQEPRGKTVAKPLGEDLGSEKDQRPGVGGEWGAPGGGNGRSERLPDLALRLKSLGVVLRFPGGRLDPEGGAALGRLSAGVHEAWLWVGLEARKR